MSRAIAPIERDDMKRIPLALVLTAAVFSTESLGWTGSQNPAGTPAAPATGEQGAGRQGGQGAGRQGAAPATPRPPREILLVERDKIIDALPAKAPATPR